MRVEAIGRFVPLRSAVFFSLEVFTRSYKSVVTFKRQPQAADVDFYTAATLVNSASACVKILRTEFCALWDICAPPVTDTEAAPVTSPGSGPAREDKNRVDEEVQLG